MDFFNFGKKTNYIGPNEVFKICQNATDNFRFDFQVSATNKKHYFDEFDKSQKFTALLICSSMVYLKSHLKDDIHFNPNADLENLMYYSVPFYGRFISLIVNEAYQINTEMMQSCLGDGLDGQADYLCMDFISKASQTIINFGDLNINTLSQLAYNYFEAPGVLNYHSKEYHNITDEIKLKTFADAVRESYKTIIMTTESKKLDYKLEYT